MEYWQVIDPEKRHADGVAVVADQFEVGGTKADQRVLEPIPTCEPPTVA